MALIVTITMLLCRCGRKQGAAASDILAAGAGLAEVGQLLRHQAQSTTAIYAKLDYRALGELVRPWPGTS
jgi:hypothetical protein